MIRWNTHADLPRGWVKMAMAALVLSAVFIGGGAALTPSPAIGLVNDDTGSGNCSDTFWVDQFACDLGEEGQNAPGGGEPTPGGDPSPPPPPPPPPPDDGRNEIIPVQGTAPPSPTKVVVGTRPVPTSTGGENGGAGRGPKGGGGRPPRAPACQKDKAGKCVGQAPYRCRRVNGEISLLGPRECDAVRKEESRQRRLRTVCLGFLDTMYSSARAIEEFTAQAAAEGSSIDEIRSEPDVAEAFSQNEEARRRWFADRCPTVFPELKHTALGQPPTDE
jgi:hypothetical protein